MLGDACYEVVPILNRIGIDMHPHLERLDRSLEAVGIGLPMSRFALMAIFRRLIRRNRLQDGLVYVQISRGTEIPRATMLLFAPSNRISLCALRQNESSPRCNPRRP